MRLSSRTLSLTRLEMSRSSHRSRRQISEIKKRPFVVDSEIWSKLPRSPLNSRIEARNSLAAVRGLPGDQHLPYGLWDALLLQHLIDFLASSAFAELHIPVVQQLCISPEKRIRRRHGSGDKRSCLCCLVDLKDRHGAIEASRFTRCAARNSGREDAVVSVIKKRERELSGGVLADKRRAVLRVEPVSGISSAKQREISLVAQFPQNTSVARPMLVVYFYQPVL